MASTFQQYVQPAQDFFGQKKEPYVTTQYVPLDSAQSSPYTPHSASMYTNTFPEGYERPAPCPRKVARVQKLQRTTGIVFGIADVCSCLLTLFIEGTMVLMLIKFYKTQHIPAPGRTSPWAKGTKLWPTYMLAGAALATLLLALTGLVLAFRKKKKHAKARLTITVIRVVLHVGCWIALAAFYRVAKTGKDLWGWSCSEKAAAIQQYYNSSLNFSQLCNIQTSTWIASIAEVGFKILFAAIGFYFQFQLDGMKRDIIKDVGMVGWESYQNLA